MRLQRVAVITAAAVGVGFLMVGCGPPPGTGSGATTGKGDTSKATTGQPPTGSDAGKELAGKVKTATEDINKDVDPMKKAIEAMKEKVTTDKKNANGDANKLDAASKLETTKDEAEALLKQVEEKLGGLKSAKDAAALDTAVKAIKELIEKAKPKLKDYMPK